MIFAIHDENIAYFKAHLEACTDDFSRFTLEKEIASFNKKIYDVAVREVALSENPISLLVDIVEVEQIRKVSDTHREISLRARSSLVTWSSVAQFIYVHNKSGQLPKIAIPFTDLDYLIVSIYGANLIKSPIPRLYERRLNKLVDINSDLKCFFSDSNTALQKQLNIVFDMISEKRKESAGVVKAIGHHSKLIHMEFLRYSSLINNLSIVDEDRLIDLIMRQYVNSLNHNRTSTTSKMSIHRIPILIDNQKSLVKKLDYIR